MVELASPLDAEVAHPVSEADLDEVYELFAKAFPPSYVEAAAHLAFIRKHEPPVPPQNYFLVRGGGGELAGALKTVDRRLMLDGCLLRVAGLSYYAIAPTYQPTTCAQQIIQALLHRIRSGPYDLSLGFARKVMDGYWSRYGFFGFSSFYSLTMDLADLRTFEAQGSVTVETQPNDEQGPFRHWYDHTYSRINGAVVRDDADWDFWMKKIARNTPCTRAVFQAGAHAVGYAVWKGNRIVELAGDDRYTEACLRRLADPLSAYQTVVFHLPYTHPAFRLLRQRNYTASARRVWDGGHIALVSHLTRFLKTLQPALERRLVASGVSPFALSCNQMMFRWDGTHLSMAEEAVPSCPHRIVFAESEWQKLLLGVEPAAMLRGFVSSGRTGIVDLVFPVLWPQVPELDEF